MIETPPLELKVGAMAAGGACVARADDGRVVFVRHSLPGEKVLAKVTGGTSSYLRADTIEVLEPSVDRVEPPCPYAGGGRCGGCDWQHIALPTQRSLKAGLVSEQLRRLAGIDPVLTVEEVAGADRGLGWRTRVRFGVDAAGRAGLHRHRSHELEFVDRCLIASPGVEAVGAERRRWPGAAAVEVLASPDGDQQVVSVSTVRTPQRALPVAGSPREIRQTVLGRTYVVTSGVFWQIHPGAAEALAQAVLEGLGPQPGERVVDLYAGAGLFAALLGEAVGPTGTVLAIDGDRRACADAARNTADQTHVKVRSARVKVALIANHIGRPDLIVLDPPRAGAGRAVSAALAALRPRRMAYVACDPASFARDLRVLLDAGWTLASLRAFDLFPMTEHVELVAILEPPTG